VSAKGNSYLNTDGFNITVVQRANAWRLIVSNRETGTAQRGRRDYATEEAAKVAAFDALIWAKENL
jgi:hypothetical protein